MKFYSAVFILLFTVSLTLAQNNQSQFQYSNREDGFFNTVKSDFNDFFNSGLGILKSPLNFQTKDYLILGAVVGTTALSFLADNKIRNEIGNIRSDKLNNYTRPGEFYGRVYLATYFSGAVYLGGHILGNSEIRKTGLILIEAVLINGMITEVLKIGFGRSRPLEKEGNVDFDGLKFNNPDNSFPSGHTSTAFTISTVLAERIKNPFVSVILYSLAGLTAFQRIYSDNHWFSDTILGAAIGIFVGHSLVSLHEDNTTISNESMHMSLLPYYDSRNYGVSFNLTM